MIQLLVQMGAPETSPPVLEISVKLANLFAMMEESVKRSQAEVGYKFAIESQKKTLEQLEQLIQAGEEVPDTAVKDAKALLGWAHQSYAFYLLGIGTVFFAWSLNNINYDVLLLSSEVAPVLLALSCNRRLCIDVYLHIVLKIFQPFC